MDAEPDFPSESDDPNPEESRAEKAKTARDAVVGMVASFGILCLVVGGLLFRAISGG